MSCLDNEDKKKLETRLNRIAGQINGINKMIAQDRECIEVLNQIISTQAALRGVWKQVVRGHLQHCITDSLIANKNANELIDELVEHIEKLK